MYHLILWINIHSNSIVTWNIAPKSSFTTTARWRCCSCVFCYVFEILKNVWQLIEWESKKVKVVKIDCRVIIQLASKCRVAKNFSFNICIHPTEENKKFDKIIKVTRLWCCSCCYSADKASFDYKNGMLPIRIKWRRKLHGN